MAGTPLSAFRLPSPIGELVGFVRDGSLCALGFTVGGGLDRKRWLLDHEKARLALPRAGAEQRALFPR